METFIARQPIFDADLNVVAYELLHRSGLTGAFDHSDPDQATLELLNTSLLVNRLEDLTDGKLGFVNVTENILLRDVIRILPPGHTVVEILETVRPTPQVVDAVRELKALGHKIALDDFEDSPAHEPLVELADFIKVDFCLTTPEERKDIVQRLARPGLRFLAEKVETREQYEQSRLDGYELFQGYFFCKPETSVKRDLPRSKVNCLQLIAEVSRDTVSFQRVEALIRREVSLSAKLLRYLNSVHFGLQREIRSIREALVQLGERPLKRWATLIAMANLGKDEPVEILRTCLVRAHFCEGVGELLRRPEMALDLFLLGMFSTLDVLTGKPLLEALKDIGLKPEIGSALQGDDTRLGKVYSLALACERADVDAYGRIAGEFGLALPRVAELYAESLFWADAVFSGKTSKAA